MKSLLFICLLVVFCGMAESVVKDYIYVSQLVNWSTAQRYCKQHYGDLTSINTEEEHQNAVAVTGQSTFFAWIGLIRTAPYLTIWQWSNGEDTKFTKWKSGQPEDGKTGMNCVVMNPTEWCDASCNGHFPAICSRRFILVKEKKTWEEALKHCRTFYNDLTFVDSEALLDLLKVETGQSQTGSVWTGLRFLNGKWFWVNGTPLGNLVSLPSCPAQPYRCGAYNFNTSVWETRDCNEELNFLCYY